jgi:single-strand DNA-binding protein
MFSINRVTLIGFLGKDAEVRHTRNNESAFTVLSLATNRSWKDRESGEYKSEVSWHRCIAFGRAGEYAASLLKGAHVQIEGEIRTREYAEKTGKKSVKKTITEIRVYRIAKLDRSGKAGSESSASGQEVPY